jgi:hypothetical protein
VELKDEIRKPVPQGVELTSSEGFMFQMEADQSFNKQSEPDENEEKVDVMLHVLLGWCRDCLSDLDAEQLPLLEDVFKILVGIFDRLLLTTNQTKYAQWALFYVCSLKEDLVTRLFEHMFDIVQNPKFPPQQRQRACMYIASMTSRASYVKESTTQMVLNYMCQWMTQYIELQGDLGRPDLSTHVLFYAMFHGIAYILRNVHESLFDRPSAKHTIQELGILMIVRSGLNPLKICSPALVHSFVDVMNRYGISFTNVLQHNEKLVIPTKDVFGPNSALTAFFPFDPYLLRRSSVLFMPFYHYPEQYNKSHMMGNSSFESGYATEGETEMDMDLTGDQDDLLRPEDGMDDEDARTTETMMVMMDFGRGSMPVASNSNKMQGLLQQQSRAGDGGSDKDTQLFGSYDEKSSISSGGHGSNSFSQNGSFLTSQPSFGHAFGAPIASPGPNSNSFLSHSPLRGTSPATDPGYSLAGSLEPRRTFSKRARDESWAPSTPVSAALFSPTATRTSPFVSISPSASTSSAWGGSPIVFSSTSTTTSDH